METEFFSDYENEEEYDSHYENDYDDTDYYEDSFYALTDGMCGDYDDGGDLAKEKVVPTIKKGK